VFRLVAEYAQVRSCAIPDEGVCHGGGVRGNRTEKEQGVIVFPNGVYDNVLKIKPPMVFQRNHVDLYCEALDPVLDQLPR
jgi:hypothetical protein